MATLNKKNRTDHRVEKDVHVAGGFGTTAAKQDAEAQLRRAVMACLLWEDVAYQSGMTVAQQVVDLVPIIDPPVVAAIARECRFDQKLRHVPLLIAREMAKHPEHRKLVRQLLNDIIFRPDELTEFLALYWQNGKTPIARQVKLGLADAFTKFDEYQLSKWNRDRDIKIRDVLFLTHPKPKSEDQAALWKRLAENELATPDTWEVGLSAAKGETERQAVWTRLIENNKLGALAVLKNLRNMQKDGLSRSLIAQAIENANPAMLLPVNFFAARKAAPDFTRSLETLMFKCAEKWPRLPGWTLFVVDVSGSMSQSLSTKSDFNRMQAAAAMSVLAAEVCENIVVYATAGSDYGRKHQTAKVQPHRGFALADEILDQYSKLGGGGIFTRQCLEYLRTQETEDPDRIIIFSDSQDCDEYYNRGKLQPPNPFGKNNYIVDVSCNTHGINYNGVWSAEISGWSENFLRYIAAHEMNPLNSK